MRAFSGASWLLGLLLLLGSCGGNKNNPDDPFCGNGILEEGEGCDDGNTTSGDGCARNCQPEEPPACGNAVLEPGEECDDGNNADGDGCTAACTLEFCGDGVVNNGGLEECDDGNSADGDGCDAACVVEPPPINLDCPRLAELPKFCVPLPGSQNQLIEVGANESCGAGFFPPNAFDVRKLFDDTILIKETNGPERPVMTLFLGQKKALLYDTGHLTGDVPDVIAPFLQGKPVEVINTHLHGDHINNNNDFAVIAVDTEVPNIRNHCGITDADFDDNQAAECNNAANYTPPNDQTLFNSKSFKVVRVVRDGHQIDLGGRQITVLFTPGHSKTSTTLHDPVHRLLFTGDTLYPDDEIPLVHPVNGANLSEYLETAQRYAAFAPQIDIVIGAHSQGVMPTRVLPAFLEIVQDRVDGGNQNRVNDPQGCDSGSFSFANFPP